MFQNLIFSSFIPFERIEWLKSCTDLSKFSILAINGCQEATKNSKQKFYSEEN